MTPTRINTVSSIFRKTQVKEYEVPYIRLSGKWIEKIGIQPGDKIEVNVQNESITITPIHK